jgi:hypothetical protein
VYVLFIPYQVGNESILLLGIEEGKDLLLSKLYIYMREDYGMSTGIP